LQTETLSVRADVKKVMYESQPGLRRGYAKLKEKQNEFSDMTGKLQMHHNIKKGFVV